MSSDPTTTSSESPLGIDAPKVSKWLAEHVPSAVAPFRFDLIAGGRSNLTYKVAAADGKQFVEIGRASCRERV